MLAGDNATLFTPELSFKPASAGVYAMEHSPAEKLLALRKNLSGVIRGKQEILDLVLIALVADGSVLIEDVPGVGKTTLAKALAASVAFKFQRVQCTPDLLPADIFGFSVFQPQDGSFHFRPGPVFCNLLLVDEINRSSPRTQSALLEAMAERQVTVEGVHRALEPPFMVLATQNPLGFHGTFPLPESQLDRFLLQISMEYPDADAEVEILYEQIDGHPVDALSPVLTIEEVKQCQAAVRQVTVEKSVARYLVDVVRRTRENPKLRLGCSPRGSLMLFRASQAAALLAGRTIVLPDDVQRVAPHVLQHRVMPAGSSSDTTALQREAVLQILNDVEVPV